jgi:hypothetical protein
MNPRPKLSLPQFEEILIRGRIHGKDFLDKVNPSKIIIDGYEIIDRIHRLAFPANFKSLEFRNCKINETIDFRINNIATEIKFDQCEVLGNIILMHDENFQYQNGRIQELSFVKLNNETNNNGAKCKILIEGIIIDYLKVEQSNFLELKTDKGFFIGEKNFDTIIKNSAIIKYSQVSNLIFNNITTEGSIIISSSDILSISINNLKGAQEIKINSNTAIKNIDLPLQTLKRVDLSDCIISTLKISGESNSELNLNIQKTKVNEIEFNKILNKGIITLRELEILPEGRLSFLSSTLGQTDFILCDFSNNKVIFENSKLEGIFLAETDFPEDVYDKENINYSQAQLLFGQLYTSFRKQGDTIRTLDYQARETKAYYNLLWNRIISVDFYQQSKKSNIISSLITFVNLLANFISNNFGRNWFQAVIFSFMVGFFFFFLLIISSNEYVISYSIDFDSKLIPSFLKFMNPLRFFETRDIFKHDDGYLITLMGKSYIIDFIGRIFVAYGYYQTIQAFRRYGRIV